MRILKAEFQSSSPDLRHCPKTNLPEFAFIGRSNVGKSSLINMITGRKGLAKVSQTPGKTRLINHFCINDEWMLVDLPGYGFAKLPKTEKEKIDRMIHEFLPRRKSLRMTFLLIDCRHELLTIDRQFINWLTVNKIIFTILLTKTDKLSRQRLAANLIALKRHFIPSDQAPHIISTSAVNPKGKEEILETIEKYCRIEKDQNFLSFR